VGFAWCAAFAFFNFKQAGYRVEQVPKRASVGFEEAYYRSQKALVKDPARGDLVNYQFDGDNWPDHVGHVERVLRTGFNTIYLQTIEGNTSPGTGGSQDDGGGVYRRRRLVRRDKVTFARVAGRPARNPDWFLESLTGKEAWVEWRLGVGRYVGWGAQNGKVRPNVQTRVPKSWWKALAKRKKEVAAK
jgi:hypothetical protein